MTGRPIRHRWPTVTVVIVLGALLQAATVLPRLTPGLSGGFVTLFLVSYLVLVASIALLGASVTDRSGRRVPMPTLRMVIASVLAPWVVFGAGLIGAPLVPVAVPIGAVLVVTAGVRGTGGRRRALLLVLATLGTILIAALAWVVALVFGFFVTGFVAALLTWIVFGALGLLVLHWWSRLLSREQGADDRVVTVSA